LTVILGAKCSDGIVMVADRKFTDLLGGTPTFGTKIFGDLEHVIIGYSGRERMFDAFRKYTLGDVFLRASPEDCYTFDNIIPRISQSIKRFNKLVCEPDFFFEILITVHRGTNLQFYYISFNGDYKQVNYKSIGSGKETTNIVCEKLSHNQITMKQFAKDAYFAIKYMNQHHPELGVGVEEGNHPIIRFMDYNKELDTSPSEEDIKEFEDYSNNALNETKRTFDKLIDSLRL